MTRWTVVLFCN